MPAMRSPLPLAALAASLANACTLVVVDDLLAPPAPCTQPSDCAAGFVCTAEECQPAEPSKVAPPAGTLVGPAGGDVTGPDGVLLAVPPGALTDDADVIIERQSATNVARGCAERSAFYRVTPALTLTAAAVLSIPVSDCEACVVCAAPTDDDEPWTALDEPPVAPAASASALVTSTGAVVVAGVAL